MAGDGVGAGERAGADRVALSKTPLTAETQRARRKFFLLKANSSSFAVILGVLGGKAFDFTES
jgi:hypothetical protein